MEPRDVDKWLREAEAALDADPGLVEPPAGPSCPKCGSTLLSVVPETGECRCRECGHKWTVGGSQGS